MAKRVHPTISEDLKKKIQAAAKVRENKGKRAIKVEVKEEDVSINQFRNQG